MFEHYTSDDLVQMLYLELPQEAAVALKQAMAADRRLAARFTALRKAKRAMPKVTFDPSPAVISRILQYSAETAV